MNAGPAFEFWLQLLGALALEASLVFLLAFGLQRWARTGAWRRTVWQVALLGLGLMAVLELTGVGRATAGWAAAQVRGRRLGIVVGKDLPAVPDLERRSPTRREADNIDRAGSETGAPDQGHLAQLGSSGETAGGAWSFPAPVSAAELRGRHLWWPGFVWLAGVGFVVGRSGMSRLLFVFGRRRGQLAADASLAARVQILAGLLGIRRPVRVSFLKQLRGPIAFGIFRPAISLPEGFCGQFTLEQREAMLIHELAHLAARDPLWYLLADAVTGLWWWHPLAWWSRRQFQAASEAAADEASLLLENGPDALAESLVELGKRLALPNSLGWLGIEGSGFRSGLGKRVQRLFELAGQSWRPANRFGGWLARAAGPVAAAAIAGAAWTLPHQNGGEASTLARGWQNSVAGLALEALRNGDEPTVEDPTDAMTNQTGRLLKVPKGERRVGLKNVIMSESLPLSHAIVSTNQDRPAESLAAAEPAGQVSGQELPVSPNSRVSRNAVQTSGGQQKLGALLDQIVLEEIAFDDLPLSEVIKFLSDEARKRDPERVGINFILTANLQQLGSLPTINPRTGLPEDPADLGTTAIKLRPPVRRITLHQALDAVTRGADRSIKYSIEDYAVVFSFKTPETPVLHTRIFKIDPNTLLQGMKDVLGLTNNVRENKGPRPLRAEEDTQELNLARRFFEAAGVTLEPPKALIYNHRSGQLMVRATGEELDMIAEAIQVLNTSPPQLVIEVKFCEIKEDDNPLSGFDWSLRSLLPTNTATATTTGILTDPQFRAVVKALEKKSGVNLLTAPKVITLSQRQAQIKVVDVKYVVTDLNITTNYAPGTGSVVSTVMQPISEPIELGPVLDVVPYVSADGFTIQMTVIASIKEFLGYDNAEDFVTAIREADGKNGLKAPKTSTTPMPKFRVRQVLTTAFVWDGQTLVLTGGSFVETGKTKDKVPLLGDLPLVGRLFQSESSTRTKKKLLIFVTPTIVDPAGNRVHSEEEMPFATKGIPPQPPPVESEVAPQWRK